MSTVVRDNERSYAIDLISQINELSQRYTLQIRKAGGERTISTGTNTRMFPDVVLYGDAERTRILQGWELKLPDTLITDEDFIKDAQRKANSLGLNSCFIWNFTSGVLYIKNEEGNFQVVKQWNDTNHIRSRADVETYRNDWEKTIENIVIDLNQIFLNGDIFGSSLGEVISDSVVVTIIERNKSLVASELRNSANTNAIMGANLDVWWDEAKTEFSADEPDKYKAYAKILLLNWTNRIVFAHLIKSHHNAATYINNISIETTPQEANTIFENISKACDFYNIFSSLDYNTCIPQETWADLMEFNQFLIENGISEIEQTSLQTILENSVSTSKRELAGQFTTPTKLAEILSKITIIDWSKPCIDPCCGTGSISQAILSNKKIAFDIETAVETTWASDKYSYPLQVANISLTSSETINEPSRVFKHNVLNLECGENIEVVNPANGELLHLEIPYFGAIASNLPFVPFEIIKDDDLHLINEIIEEVRNNTNVNLSRRSDLYCFIIFSLHKLIENGGRIGVITSNSWLGTSWGKEFFKALNEYFEVNQIHISGNKRWFNNAQIVTTILILTKKAEIVSPENNTLMSFYKWNKSLSEIENEPEFSDTIVRSALLDRELNSDVIGLSRYTYQQIEDLQSLNISLNALFHNVMWLLDIKDKLIPISEVFTVFRGERRGWDDMFYPVDGHGIEPICIKRVLKNARRVTSLFAEADNDAFCCSFSKEELRQQNLIGTLNWIERFENGVNGTGRPLTEVLKRSNMYWYEMRDTATADICTTMNPDKRLFFAKFEEPTFINQRLIGLKKKPNYQDIELYHALLNSIIGMFYIEAIGFGRGLGALDINNTTLKNAFMLDPKQVSDENRIEILNKFAVVCRRDVMNTMQEIDQADRVEFDTAVLKAFDIESIYPDIKNSLISMQKSRLSVR